MKPTLRAALALSLTALLAGGLLLPVLAQLPPPSEQPQGPLPPKPTRPEDEPGYTLRVDVPVINVDVTVVDKNGGFVSGLRREHFRVYQDNVEQEIVAFAPTEAPITTVLLVEASPQLQELLYQNIDAAYLFLNQLRKDDWVALVGYDVKPRIEVDFTHDRNEVINALRHMQYGAGRFSELALYDALADTLENLKEVECQSDTGCKKSIILIAGGAKPDIMGRSGIDTISKLTWDDVRKRVRASRVTIFTIDMSWITENRLDRADALGHDVARQRLDVQIGKAQLQDIAEQTGGQMYSVRFQGQLPSIYSSIALQLRNQYSLAFRPKNFKRDGKYHKISVKLVGGDGQPLQVIDQNQKPVKYEILARKGYYAPES
jgi:VWFA-related protein